MANPKNDYQQKYVDYTNQSKSLNNNYPDYSSAFGSASNRKAGVNWGKYKYTPPYARENIDFEGYLPQKNRGFLDRSFDALNIGTYASQGFLTDGVEGMMKGLRAGNPFGDGYEEGEYTFDDTLNKYTDWEEWKPDKWYSPEGLLKGGVNLAGDIFLDPLTYVTFGVGGLAKGTGTVIAKGLGRETVERVSREAVEAMVKKTGKEVTEDAVTRYMTKVNKMRGINDIEGFLSNDIRIGLSAMWGGKKGTIKLVDESVIKKIGDATIAPYFNAIRKKMGESSVAKLFNTSYQLRKIASSDPEQAIRFMATFDQLAQIKKLKIMGDKEVREYVDKALSGFNKETQRQILNYLETPMAWKPFVDLEIINDTDTLSSARKLLDDTIADLTASKAIAKKNAWGGKAKVKGLEDLLKDDKVIDRLLSPETDGMKRMYKRFIDPTNKYQTYEEAISAFHIDKLRKPKDIDFLDELPDMLKGYDLPTNKGDNFLKNADEQYGKFNTAENTDKLYDDALLNNEFRSKNPDLVNKNYDSKAPRSNLVEEDLPAFDLNPPEYKMKNNLVPGGDNGIDDMGIGFGESVDNGVGSISSRNKKKVQSARKIVDEAKAKNLNATPDEIINDVIKANPNVADDADVLTSVISDLMNDPSFNRGIHKQVTNTMGYVEEVNWFNLDKQQTLFNQRGIFSRWVKQTPLEKANSLNDILFDGKNIISPTSPVKQLNAIAKSIKDGADVFKLSDAIYKTSNEGNSVYRYLMSIYGTDNTGKKSYKSISQMHDGLNDISKQINELTRKKDLIHKYHGDTSKGVVKKIDANEKVPRAKVWTDAQEEQLQKLESSYQTLHDKIIDRTKELKYVKSLSREQFDYFTKTRDHTPFSQLDKKYLEEVQKLTPNQALNNPLMDSVNGIDNKIKDVESVKQSEFVNQEQIAKMDVSRTKGLVESSTGKPLTGKEGTIRAIHNDELIKDAQQMTYRKQKMKDRMNDYFENAKKNIEGLREPYYGMHFADGAKVKQIENMQEALSRWVDGTLPLSSKEAHLDFNIMYDEVLKSKWVDIEISSAQFEKLLKGVKDGGMFPSYRLPFIPYGDKESVFKSFLGTQIGKDVRVRNADTGELLLDNITKHLTDDKKRFALMEKNIRNEIHELKSKYYKKGFNNDDIIRGMSKEDLSTLRDLELKQIRLIDPDDVAGVTSEMKMLMEKRSKLANLIHENKDNPRVASFYKKQYDMLPKFENESHAYYLTVKDSAIENYKKAMVEKAKTEKLAVATKLAETNQIEKISDVIPEINPAKQELKQKLWNKRKEANVSMLAPDMADVVEGAGTRSSATRLPNGFKNDISPITEFLEKHKALKYSDYPFDLNSKAFFDDIKSVEIQQIAKETGLMKDIKLVQDTLKLIREKKVFLAKDSIDVSALKIQKELGISDKDARHVVDMIKSGHTPPKPPIAPVPFNPDNVEYEVIGMLEEQLRKAKIEQDVFKLYDDALTNEITLTDAMNARLYPNKANNLLDGVYNKGMGYTLKDGEIYTNKLLRRLAVDDPDLSQEVISVTNELSDKLLQMGLNEAGVGKLKTFIEAYAPHIVNPAIKDNAIIMEQLRKANPDLYKKVLTYAGDKFNPYGMGRSENFRNAFGSTVREINDAMKPLLKQYGVDENFFINEIGDAYLARALKSNDVIYSNHFIDEMVGEFGTRVTRDSIENKGIYYVTQKDLKSAFSTIKPERQMEVLGLMGFKKDKVYNRMLIEVTGDEYLRMIDVANKYGGELTHAYTLPSHVAQQASNLGYSQMLRDTNAFLKAYDNFTLLFKTAVTVANPGFHARNAISNNWQNYLAVGSETFNPKIRSAVRNVLSNQQGELVTNAGKKIPFEEIRTLAVVHDIVSSDKFVKNAVNNAEQARSLVGKELQGKSEGILSAIGRRIDAPPSQLAKSLDPTDTANFFIYEWGRNIGQGVEDYDRMINFVAGLKNGLEPVQASAQVEKFLFDYADITGFEKNVMKRIIPFYTWLRKNAPLQIEAMMTQPGKYRLASKFTQNANKGMTDEERSYLPEFMQDWIQLPIEINDKSMFINPNMPYGNINSLEPNAKNIIGITNPLIKAGIELPTNNNVFFGNKIWNADTLGEDLGAYAMNQTGWVNSTLKTIEGGLNNDLDGLLNGIAYTTGVKTRAVNMDDAKKQAIYSAILRAEKENKNKKLTEEEKREAIAKKLRQYGVE